MEKPILSTATQASLTDPTGKGVGEAVGPLSNGSGTIAAAPKLLPALVAAAR